MKISLFNYSILGYISPKTTGAIALSYSPRVKVRATVKLSAAFFHDESSITLGGVGGCTKGQ